MLLKFLTVNELANRLIDKPVLAAMKLVGDSFQAALNVRLQTNGRNTHVSSPNELNAVYYIEFAAATLPGQHLTIIGR